MTVPTSPKDQPVRPATVEEFLARIESKSSSPAHIRLLKAARSIDPLAAMTAELAKLATEIVDETR